MPKINSFYARVVIESSLPHHTERGASIVAPLSNENVAMQLLQHHICPEMLPGTQQLVVPKDKLVPSRCEVIKHRRPRQVLY